MGKITGKIQSVSGPREFNGVMQVGFTLEKNPKKWYNVPGEEQILNELKEGIVMKGAEISFEYTEKTKKVGEINLEKMPEKTEKTGGQEDMTNFEDLLSVAHKKFGDRMQIKTDILRDGSGNILIDFDKKRALFKAQVFVREEAGKYIQVFEGHGDATEDNVTGNHIQPHFIRMAETRSIVRALRWATNNAAVAQEETGGKDGPGK